MAKLKRIHLLCVLGAIVVAGAGVLTYNFVSQAAPAGPTAVNAQTQLKQAADISDILDNVSPPSAEEAVLAKMTKYNEKLAKAGANYRLESIQLLNWVGKGGLSGYNIHKQSMRPVADDWWRFADFDYPAIQCTSLEEPGMDYVATWNAQGVSDFNSYGGRKISYMVDPTFGNVSPSALGSIPGLSAAETEPAIDRAMATLGKAFAKYGIDVVKVPYDGKDHASVSCFFGVDMTRCSDECGPWGKQKELPKIFTPGANIIFDGWQPDGFWSEIFDLNSIPFLGAAAFGYVWDNSDAAQVSTDINLDNYLDAAWTEIYFRDGWRKLYEGYGWEVGWGLDSLGPVIYDKYAFDVESVALHEAAHALGIPDRYTGFCAPKDTPAATKTVSSVVGCDAPYSRDLFPRDIASLDSLYSSWGNFPSRVPLPMEFGPITIQQPAK